MFANPMMVYEFQMCWRRSLWTSGIKSATAHTMHRCWSQSALMDYIVTTAWLWSLEKEGVAWNAVLHAASTADDFSATPPF